MTGNVKKPRKAYWKILADKLKEYINDHERWSQEEREAFQRQLDVLLSKHEKGEKDVN